MKISVFSECIRAENFCPSMSDKTKGNGKIPEKFDDNVVLFLCRGHDRRKVRFRKRDSGPNFKHEVLYDSSLISLAFLYSRCLFTLSLLSFHGDPVIYTRIFPCHNHA